MFDKRNNPLADSVKQIMQESDLDRKVEEIVNEALGIESRKALPHENLADYDILLEEVQTAVRENPEQLDELSRKTLKSYLKKTDNDGEGLEKRADRWKKRTKKSGEEGKAARKTYKKVRQKMSNRLHGYMDAEDRLSGEMQYKDPTVQSKFKSLRGWNYKKYSLKETPEQLDELSRKTLGRYIKKARDQLTNDLIQQSDDLSSHSKKEREAKRKVYRNIGRLTKRQKAERDKEITKWNKRDANVELAINKVTRDKPTKTSGKPRISSHGFIEWPDSRARVLAKEEIVDFIDQCISEGFNEIEIQEALSEAFQLDELSRKTLKSYLKKSEDESEGLGKRADKWYKRRKKSGEEGKAARKTYKKIHKKMSNRLHGYMDAKDRLSGEMQYKDPTMQRGWNYKKYSLKETPEQLDELSRKTLKSYLRKAEDESESAQKRAIKYFERYRKGGSSEYRINSDKAWKKSEKRDVGRSKAFERLRFNAMRKKVDPDGRVAEYQQYSPKGASMEKRVKDAEDLVEQLFEEIYTNLCLDLLEAYETNEETFNSFVDNLTEEQIDILFGDDNVNFPNAVTEDDLAEAVVNPFSDMNLIKTPTPQTMKNYIKQRSITARQEKPNSPVLRPDKSTNVTDLPTLQQTYDKNIKSFWDKMRARPFKSSSTVAQPVNSAQAKTAAQTRLSGANAKGFKASGHTSPANAPLNTSKTISGQNPYVQGNALSKQAAVAKKGPTKGMGFIPDKNKSQSQPTFGHDPAPKPGGLVNPAGISGAIHNSARPAPKPATTTPAPTPAPSPTVKTARSTARPTMRSKPSTPKRRWGFGGSGVTKTASKGLSAGAITNRALGGVYEENAPEQVKESFESFLKNTFMKD